MIGTPAILKTRRFGYDGKGQARIDRAEDAAAAFEQLQGAPAILEGFVPFTHEVSVIAGARSDRRDRVLRSGRERASRRHPAHHDRAGPTERATTD